MKNPSNNNSLRLGIIGVGAMGATHARRLMEGLAANVSLTALCDHHPERKENFPGIPFFENHEELLASDLVDAVLIATPHYDHTEIGIAALEAGLHVLVEKPMAVHKTDAERLLAVHAKTDRVLTTMLSMRTKPMFKKIKDLLDSGDLGQLRRIHWTMTDWFRTQAYFDNASWRGTWNGEGGGILLNQCPHQLDLWCWLFGQPDEVTSHCSFGRYHNIETEDDVTAVLSYRDGTQGVFAASTGEWPGTQRLEIVGENGKLLAEDNRLIFHRNRQGMTDFSHTTELPMSGPETWRVEIPVEPIPRPGHLDILENFAAAIAHGSPLLAEPEEALLPVELANAMLLSTWQRQPISLPIDGTLYEQELENRIAESSRSSGRKVPA